jgi:hypothetical protein
LGWVTNPKFITDAGGYTQNALVKEGWQITRDLVNMFFVLIMVGIGIATILRVKGYEIKKLLPKAIAIILLINFTPIICGLIIDASNILTNFFLSAGSRGMGEMINRIEAPQSSIGGQIRAFLKGAVTGNWEKMAFSIFHSIITLSFNLFASFILLILAMLFLMRYIMLWILVILSPLAFFCYILPKTKKIWDMWWDQFIQWCFIGIGAAFFLYLTQRMIDIIGSGTFITSPSAGEMQMGDSGLVIVFVYLVPMVFLAAGFMATTMFAPMGAKQIIGLAKWPMTKQGKKARAKFKKWRQSKARNIPVVGPKVQKAISKLGSYKPGWGQDPGKGTKAGRWTKRQAADVIGVATKIAAEPTKMVFGEGTAAGRQATKEAYKEAKDQDMWTNISKLKTVSAEQKVGILRAMGEEKQMKEAVKQNRLPNNDVIEAYRHATLTNNKKAKDELEIAMLHNKSMMGQFAKIAEKATGDKGGLSEEDKKKGYQTFQEMVLAKQRKEEDFKKIQFNKLKEDLGDELGDILLRIHDPHQVAQAGRALGRDYTDIVQRKAHEKPIAWFFEIDEATGKAQNSQLPRFFASTGARNLGLSRLPGAGNIKELDGLQNTSGELENKITLADTTDKLSNLIEQIKHQEKEEKSEDIKKVLSSARAAAQRKLQETPRTIETEQGKITISKEATEDTRRQRERREPGAEERGGDAEARARTGRERREPGPDER